MHIIYLFLTVWSHCFVSCFSSVWWETENIYSLWIWHIYKFSDNILYWCSIYIYIDGKFARSRRLSKLSMIQSQDPTVKQKRKYTYRIQCFRWIVHSAIICLSCRFLAWLNESCIVKCMCYFLISPKIQPKKPFLFEIQNKDGLFSHIQPKWAKWIIFFTWFAPIDLLVAEAIYYSFRCFFLFGFSLMPCLYYSDQTSFSTSRWMLEKCTRKK